MAERELQLPVFAPSAEHLNLYFNFLQHTVLLEEKDWVNSRRQLRRRHSVNICRMKIHTLASRLPSFILSSLLARHHEEYKEKGRDLHPLQFR